MSDSVRPHRQQPTRLHRPWDSPVKNTGVGCHFLLQCMKVKCESEVVQSCPTLSDPMDCSPPGSSIHGIFQARVLEWGALAFSQWHSEPLMLTHRVMRPYVGLFISPLCFTCSKAMAPHSSALAWKIPWTEEPGRLQSTGSRRVGHDWRRKWWFTPVFLPGESQGWGSLVGTLLWGRTESDTTEAT